VLHATQNANPTAAHTEHTTQDANPAAAHTKHAATQDTIGHDEENYAPMVPVQDDSAIYSPQDHQMLEDIQSHFRGRFPPRTVNYYENALQLSSIICCKHKPPSSQKKTLDKTPPPKRQKTVSKRCSCAFSVNFTLTSRVVKGALTIDSLKSFRFCVFFLLLCLFLMPISELLCGAMVSVPVEIKESIHEISRKYVETRKMLLM
jgi:hypothetical protein